jgi:hypothetical protein
MMSFWRRGAADWHTIQISSFAKTVVKTAAGAPLLNNDPVENGHPWCCVIQLWIPPPMLKDFHLRGILSAPRKLDDPQMAQSIFSCSQQKPPRAQVSQTQMSEALQAQFLGVLNRCETKLHYLNFQNGFA